MDTRPELIPHPSQSSSTASPPSLSSSPSHEFSFTISLHSAAAPPPLPDKSRAPPQSSAAVLDLSPADDIFSHGHLLPLHLLTHPPAASPRSSTTSLDSLSLPIRNLLCNSKTPIRIQTDPANNTSDLQTEEGHKTKPNTNNTNSKSMFFGLWRKTSDRENKDGDEKEKKLKKLMNTDLGRVVKRYARMVLPLLPIGRRRRREEEQIQRQSYSFSGNLLGRGIRREEFSAPASMRASPTNSGLLLAKSALPSTANDSTMEELQAAIQAAIAHCKNSIAHPDDKVIC